MPQLGQKEPYDSIERRAELAGLRLPTTHPFEQNSCTQFTAMLALPCSGEANPRPESVAPSISAPDSPMPFFGDVARLAWLWFARGFSLCH